MIGFFVISTHLGGAEKSLYELLLEINETKDQWMLFVPKADGPLIEKLEENNFKYISIDIPKWYLKVSRNKKLYTIMSLPLLLIYGLVLHFKISNLLKKHDIKTVHSTGLKFHLHFGLISFFKPQTKFILHIRDIIHSKALRKMFQTFAKNKNVSLIANSQMTQRSLGKTQSHLIYNGFNLPPKLNSQLKEKLNISQDTFLVGVVGVIARWKGQREFIEMAEKVLKTHSQCHFVIVGSEIYDTNAEVGELKFLNSLVESSQYSKQFHFLEFQDNIHEVYQGLDILVHSSIKPEPFGRVVVEAMLNALPVTASNEGGPTEIIVDGKSGLLHTQSDPESMAQNVKKLIDDNNLRSSLSNEAERRAHAFSMSKHKQLMASQLGLKIQSTTDS